MARSRLQSGYVQCISLYVAPPICVALREVGLRTSSGIKISMQCDRYAPRETGSWFHYLMRSQEPFSVFIEISSKPLRTAETTVPSRFAAIAFCTKAMSAIVKSIFSSKAYQSFLEAKPQDHQPSGTADVGKGNGIAASGEKDPPTMSPTQDNYYQPTNNASSTRFAAKCHPDADAVCAELDAFFPQNWPWANDRAREEFLKTDCNR